MERARGYEKAHPGMVRPASILIPSDMPETQAFSSSPARDPLDWDARDVAQWIEAKDGVSEYAPLFREHNVSGIVLPMLDSSHLLEMGVSRLKDRITLKREISLLLATSTKRGEVNATVFAQSFTEVQSLMMTTQVVQQLSKQLQRRGGSDPEYRRMMEQFNKLREEMLPIFKLIKDTKPLPTPEGENTFNTTPSPSTTNSPTKMQRPLMSPTYFDTHSRRSTVVQSTTVSAAAKRKSMQFSPTSYSSPRSPGIPSRSVSLEQAPTLSRDSSTFDIQTQLRANTEDSCLKVLQAAMRRHKLNPDDWKKYALVICYGDQERVLDYHERPVVVVKELGELGKTAAIMLRQVEDTQVTPEDEDVMISVTPGGRL